MGSDEALSTLPSVTEAMHGEARVCTQAFGSSVLALSQYTEELLLNTPGLSPAVSFSASLAHG